MSARFFLPALSQEPPQAVAARNALCPLAFHEKSKGSWSENALANEVVENALNLFTKDRSEVYQRALDTGDSDAVTRDDMLRRKRTHAMHSYTLAGPAAIGRGNLDEVGIQRNSPTLKRAAMGDDRALSRP
jgi:hypothetical protein